MEAVTKLVCSITVVSLDTTVVIVTVGTKIDAKVVVLPGTVVAGTVVGNCVLAGSVVVYVSVTKSPSALAGIAPPIPDAVYWLGIARVAVFGFLASSSA